MKINSAGLSLIKKFEGLRLTAYIDPVGVLTIGYGHTGSDVKPGMKITEAQAEQLLRSDLGKHETYISNKVKVALNENQFSAIVSFAFNVGNGAFGGSTLLTKLNEGDYAGAAAEFGKWVKGTIDGKKVTLPGLVKRRQAERALFDTLAAHSDAVRAFAADRDTARRYNSYIVGPNDTLSQIAARHGVNLDTLLEWNPQIADPNLIHPGDVILLLNVEPVGEEFSETIATSRMPWYDIAKTELGVEEWEGAGRNNPRIIEYHKSTTLDWSEARLDETPWCSSFVNWCVEKSGLRGTDSAWARSWNTWGRGIDSPVEGCIVVFSRPSGGPRAGHVGFYASASGANIEVLGGNQSDRVRLKNYPKNRVIGFRLPS